MIGKDKLFFSFFRNFELMPASAARAILRVISKPHESYFFKITQKSDREGNETVIDYVKMMKIISDSGFKNYIDVEY